MLAFTVLQIDKTSDPATKALLQQRLVQFLAHQAALQQEADSAAAGLSGKKTPSAISKAAAAFDFTKPKNLIGSKTLTAASNVPLSHEDQIRRVQRAQRFADACDEGGEKVSQGLDTENVCAEDARGSGQGQGILSTFCSCTALQLLDWITTLQSLVVIIVIVTVIVIVVLNSITRQVALPLSGTAVEYAQGLKSWA